MKADFLLLKALLMQKIQKFRSLLTAYNIMPDRETEVHFALAVIFPDGFSSHFSLNPAIRSYSWTGTVGNSTLLSLALWPLSDITGALWQT